MLRINLGNGACGPTATRQMRVDFGETGRHGRGYPRAFTAAPYGRMIENGFEHSHGGSLQRLAVPNDADRDTFDRDRFALQVDHAGRERRVFGDQLELVAMPADPLDGDFVMQTHDDDLPGPEFARAMDRKQVPVQNACVAHA